MLKELHENQKTEAVRRMKMLDLLPQTIQEFEKENKLNLSEFNGILYWLNEEEKKLVADWEKETGCMVFHVIKDHFVFGLCYTFMYVSQNPDEWETEAEEMKEGSFLAYVLNKDCPDFSEYGYVEVKPNMGGLQRTA